MQTFGVRLLGLNVDNGRKLLLSVGVVAALWVVAKVVHVAVGALHRRGRHPHLEFWAGQLVRVFCTVTGALVLFSIWFDDRTQAPVRLGREAAAR